MALMINPRCRSRSGTDALQCFVAADVQPKAAANFAAGMALVAAIEAAASVEVGAVAASLRTLHLSEFYADISFDANGQMNSSRLAIQQEAWVERAPSSVASPGHPQAHNTTANRATGVQLA